MWTRSLWKEYYITNNNLKFGYNTSWHVFLAQGVLGNYTGGSYKSLRNENIAECHNITVAENQKCLFFFYFQQGTWSFLNVKFQD